MDIIYEYKGENPGFEDDMLNLYKTYIGYKKNNLNKFIELNKLISSNIPENIEKIEELLKGILIAMFGIYARYTWNKPHNETIYLKNASEYINIFIRNFYLFGFTIVAFYFSDDEETNKDVAPHIYNLLLKLKEV